MVDSKFLPFLFWPYALIIGSLFAGEEGFPLFLAGAGWLVIRHRESIADLVYSLLRNSG
jgi:hypothetical protein